jgi:death-on-curing family protein
LNTLISKQLLDERLRIGAAISELPSSKSRPHHLSADDVLDAHFAIADFFYREDYGMAGVGFRDIGNFVSTVERQFTNFGGISAWADEYEEISSLLFGIIKNHPFYDGNKRTAFLCCMLQLHRMGRQVTVAEKELEDLMVEIADGTIHNKSALKDLLKAKVSQPEVKYLATYLRRNSRKTAKLSGTIKFRDLRRIVESNGFGFNNPNRGTIDIIKTEEKRVPRFFFGDRVERSNRVVQNISYHGEGIDVPDSTIKLVRQVCGLTDQDGFDGEVLLRDATPTFKLIKSYRTALQNLAFR